MVGRHYAPAGELLVKGECLGALVFAAQAPPILTAIRRPSGLTAAGQPYLISTMAPIGRKHLPHDGGPLHSASPEGEVYYLGCRNYP